MDNFLTEMLTRAVGSDFFAGGLALGAFGAAVGILRAVLLAAPDGVRNHWPPLRTALAAAPILIPALVAGLLLGMVQAATSINEQTLTFVPKLIVVAVMLAIFGGSVMLLVADFAREIFERIPEISGG